MKPDFAAGFLALIAAPAIHAQLLFLVKGERRAHQLATLGSAAAFVIASFLAYGFIRQADAGAVFADVTFAPGYALHFGVDALNAPLLPMHTLLTLAVVVAGPRAAMGRKELRALLWVEFLTLLALTTMDLLVLALGFTLVLIPAYRLTLRAEGPRRALLARIFTLYHLSGALAFLTAVTAMAIWSRTLGKFDLTLTDFDVSLVPERYRTLLFMLLATAALIRMGVAPFHSWLPVSFEHGSSVAVVLLVSTRTGLYMLARVALPAFPEAARAALPFLVALALVSALYGALGALGQRDLRRMLGFFVVSQSGIMLVGFALGDAHAISGALLYWIGFAIATTGLSLMLTALRSRTGCSDMMSFGGIVRDMPMLSACFFLFGLATIAIPGSVAFAAEDMLIHGALELHPWLSAGMIVAMVINAITFMRAFALAFLGTRHTDTPRGTLQDLGTRERISAVTLVLSLFVLGIKPGPLVSLQTRAARDIARLEHAPSRASDQRERRLQP
jgi:NADH-quinone oxidoreductase subunit M